MLWFDVTIIILLPHLRLRLGRGLVKLGYWKLRKFPLVIPWDLEGFQGIWWLGKNFLGKGTSFRKVDWGAKRGWNGRAGKFFAARKFIPSTSLGRFLPLGRNFP